MPTLTHSHKLSHTHTHSYMLPVNLSPRKKKSFNIGEAMATKKHMYKETRIWEERESTGGFTREMYLI